MLDIHSDQLIPCSNRSGVTTLSFCAVMRGLLVYSESDVIVVAQYIIQRLPRHRFDALLLPRRQANPPATSPSYLAFAPPEPTPPAQSGGGTCGWQAEALPRRRH